MHGVDNVGTVPAALTAYLALEARRCWTLCAFITAVLVTARQEARLVQQAIMRCSYRKAGIG